VLKPEKQAELAAYKKKWRKFFGYKDGRLLSFKEVKSHRMFSQLVGGNADGYVEMFEFESLAGLYDEALSGVHKSYCAWFTLDECMGSLHIHID